MLLLVIDVHRNITLYVSVFKLCAVIKSNSSHLNRTFEMHLIRYHHILYNSNS